MSAREPFALAAFGEFFEPIGPHRVEQPIARDGAARHPSDERLRDQIGDAVHDFRRRDLGARNNRACRFQAEDAGEYRQAPQDHPLGLAQQLVAPVERRPQRLVARQGGAPAAGQDPEAIVEVCGDLLNSEHGGARRRQLDRQRDAVEPPADRRDHRCTASVRRKMRLRRAQPVDK